MPPSFVEYIILEKNIASNIKASIFKNKYKNIHPSVLYFSHNIEEINILR